MNDLLMILISALGVIVTGLASWLTQRIIAFLNKKIENQKAQAALITATEIVSDSVKLVTQTFVDNLKKEGKFNKDAAQEAFNLALKNVENTMSPEIKSFISNQYGDLIAWITTKIEATIFDTKNKISN